MNNFIIEFLLSFPIHGETVSLGKRLRVSINRNRRNFIRRRVKNSILNANWFPKRHRSRLMQCLVETAKDLKLMGVLKPIKGDYENT